MALKTFNLNQEVYEEFSKHCKENGISMSKKVENFIKEELGRLRSGLEIDKGTKMPKGLPGGLPRPNKEHPMGKYC